MRAQTSALLLLCCLLSCGCNRKQPQQTAIQPPQELTAKTDTPSIAPPKRAIARRLDSLGFVSIAEADSSIAIDLMYTRADNFTGTVLYEDFKEAYLHPEAMESLKKAQRLLKAEQPGLQPHRL